MLARLYEYCESRSIPQPDRMALSIVAAQVGNLLKGGYAVADIRDTLLQLASEFNLVVYHRGLSRLQQTVQQVYEDRRVAEHRLIKAERFVAPEVAQAMGAPLRAFTGATAPYDPDWRRRCTRKGCERIALFGSDFCARHEP